MKKLNLKENEENKIFSVGFGGYIEISKRQDFYKLFERQKQEMDNAIKNDLTGEGFIKQMFRYELANHEYYISRDLEDVLDALELSIENINNNKALINGLNLAKEEYLEDCLRAEETDEEEFE